MICPNCGFPIDEHGTDPNAEWGRRMRVTRKAAGIGLRQLARMVGLSSSYVRDIETGKRNKPDEEKVREWEALLQ